MYLKFDGWKDSHVIIGPHGTYMISEITPGNPTSMALGDEKTTEESGSLVHIQGLPSFYCKDSPEDVADRLDSILTPQEKVAAVFKELMEDHKCTSSQT